MSKATAVCTRSAVPECPIFGIPMEHNGRNLPTFCDAIKHYLLLRHESKMELNGKDPSFKDISSKVVDHIVNAWDKASIPTVSRRRIEALFKSFYDNYGKILKSFRKNQCTENKLDHFKSGANIIIDICSCKCRDFNNCHCVMDKKVPAIEREFLTDQRTSRKMIMGSVDRPVTAKLNKRLTRSLTEESFASEPSTSGQVCSEIITESCSHSESESTTSSTASDFEPSQSTIRRIINHDNQPSRLQVENVALMCDKMGVSDRAAAVLVSSALEEAGVMDETNKDHYVVDRHKIRRARKRKRSKLSEGATVSDTEKLQSVFFDERKDLTKVKECVSGKTYITSIKEEHISLIEEPNSNFLGHITPPSGSARDIASTILSFFKDNGTDMSAVVAVGCDGTAVNTGFKGGVVRLLEENMKKPLQWIVCLLHCNELPLRHLINNIDGKTTGPASFKGPIGSKLNECEKLPIVEFEQIQGEELVVTTSDLSTDQKYLLKIYTAVTSGHCPDDVARLNPGKIHHARWLTTANRIIRLYVSENEPSSELMTIVNYIIRVYIPVWFSIKCKPSIFYGSIHFHKLVILSRYMEPKYRQIIDSVIKNNCYFGHPENVLLAMIHDDSPTIRELGLRRILKARSAFSEELRRFSFPSLNLNASHYHEMVDWQNTPVTEPPATKKIPDEELKRLITNKEKPSCIPSFPCHTQAVERAIKLVTEASSSVIGEERDGFIRAKMEGRKRLPAFETKKDFKLQK